MVNWGLKKYLQKLTLINLLHRQLPQLEEFLKVKNFTLEFAQKSQISLPSINNNAWF